MLRLFSAFGGKADIGLAALQCLLLIQSGHERLRIAAVRPDRRTPFRRSQIPAVISNGVGVVLSLGEGNATARFHQRDFSLDSVATRSPRAAARAKTTRRCAYGWPFIQRFQRTGRGCCP